MGGPHTLAEGARLWIVALDDHGDFASVAHLLAPEERRSACGFLRERLRNRYAVGRTALRLLLGAQLALDAEAVPLAAGPNGKPRLACDAGVEFNLSHCESTALIGITSGIPIGVDVERSPPAAEVRRLATRSFDPYEAAVIADLPDDLARAAFVRCWTAKEAVLKAIGTGLAWPLRDVVIEPDPRRAPRLLSPPRDFAPNAWTLCELGLSANRMTVSVAIAAAEARIAGVHRFGLKDWLA